MGKYDAILDKLKKSASDRDAKTAKRKCPLRKKPAIYVAVVRGDTGDAVSSVQVDISKPTKQSPSTNGDGEIKVDPAKTGSHGLKVLLTRDQEKQFAAPQPAPVVTSGAETAIQCFVLEPLPKLLVEVKDKETNKPVDGVAVRAGQLPVLNTSGGKADFGGVPAGTHTITVTVPKPLDTKVEVQQRGVSLNTFEPGYPITWTAELPYGDNQAFTVLLAKVRWIEFILAEEGTDKPIANARIFAKLPGGQKTIATTNELGNARITYAQDGKVEIEKIELRDPGSITKEETR
jgi:hypothetical protein